MATKIATILLAVVLANFLQTVLAAGNYTIAEKQALKKFRSLVEPQLYRDFMRRDEYLIRWIRDEKFDLNKAQGRLLASIKWRKENKIDAVVNEDYSDILKHCGFSLDARDRKGRPVLTTSAGTCSIRKLILQGQTERYRRLNFQNFEKITNLVQQLEAEGQKDVNALAISDMSGFNLREHFCLQCIPLEVEFTNLYQKYYPEYFAHFIVINAPKAFENVLGILRPYLSGHSLNILEVYGFNKDEWQKAVLKYISPEQLEPSFGGTKKIRRATPT